MIEYVSKVEIRSVLMSKKTKKSTKEVDAQWAKSQKKSSSTFYVNILSGQKLIKNAKNGPFLRVFENLKLAVKQC